MESLAFKVAVCAHILNYVIFVGLEITTIAAIVNWSKG